MEQFNYCQINIIVAFYAGNNKRCDNRKRKETNCVRIALLVYKFAAYWNYRMDMVYNCVRINCKSKINCFTAVPTKKNSKSAVPGTLTIGNFGVRTIFGPNVERCQEEEMNKYSTEEKQQAIDLYFKNGCNMKKTVREGGADAFLDLN